LRVPLYEGLPFMDRSYPNPDPEARKLVFPLIGIRAFRRAGLKICLDMTNLTLSVWTPGSLIRNAARSLRRMPNRFSRLSLWDLVDEHWVG
jgi:hypothetical protein